MSADRPRSEPDQHPGGTDPQDPRGASGQDPGGRRGQNPNAAPGLGAGQPGESGSAPPARSAPGSPAPRDGGVPPESAPPADVDDPAQIALNRAREAARAKGLHRGRPRPGRTGAPRRAGPGHPGAVTGSGRDPQLLGDTAAELSRVLGWHQPLSVGGVVGRWADVVGPQIAEHCTPETFIDGDLVVRADSTAWATQIRLLLPQLERRLAEEVGEGVVTSIQVLGPGGPTWRKGPRSVRGRGPRDTYG